MPRFRKYVIVHFNDHKSAQDAFCTFRAKYPSRLRASQDLSRVEGNTVYIQENSLNISNVCAEKVLMECEGAFPVSG